MEELFSIQFLFMMSLLVIHFVREVLTYWWPVTDEEWERQNYPERFNIKCS